MRPSEKKIIAKSYNPPIPKLITVAKRKGKEPQPAQFVEIETIFFFPTGNATTFLQ